MRLSRTVPPHLLGSALLAAALLLLFFAPLLSPKLALAARDIPFFHLPLRTTFRNLLFQEGLPAWNPMIHGGQPILSNPNYAAFYPPTWLGLLLPPAYALNLLVPLHAVLAYAGAWRLARRLGCRPAAAALAGVGYLGGGAFLSMTAAFPLYCGLAWLPWILAWGEETLRAQGSWRRPALLGGVALALQILAGDPVAVLLSGLGLVGLGASALLERTRRQAALRLAVPAAFALLLAAVQIVPTWQRLRDSPRGEGLSLHTATIWSAPPVRLVEFVFPRFFGDPTRDEEDLYFGWKIHDRSYPYVVSIYPGLLMTLLGLAALLRGPLPRRLAWGFGVVAGVALGLGRHNPLYRLLHEGIPLLAMIRYPEKFLLLAAVSLTFAGALGWERILAARRQGRVRESDFSLALALTFTATAATLAAILAFAPGVGEAFVRDHSGLPPSPALVAKGLAFLRAEAWISLALGLAATGLLALCRSRRVPESLLAALAVGLLAVDLWHYGQGFNRVVPASLYQEPPALAREILRSSHRVFNALPLDPEPQPEIFPRPQEPGSGQLRMELGRLKPYSGNLWGIAYALNQDYDLMLTGWGRHALDLLEEEWSDPDLAYRILGSWEVGQVVVRRPVGELIAEAQGGTAGPAARLVQNPYALSRFRFVPRVRYHPTLEQAVEVAREDRYNVPEVEDVWAPTRGDAPAEATYSREAYLLEVQEGGARIRIRYLARGGAFLVAALTFDPGWSAAVEGLHLLTYPTALGQLGVELPPGQQEVVLEYRDPWVGVGASITLITLLLWALAGVQILRRSGRRRESFA